MTCPACGGRSAAAVWVGDCWRGACGCGARWSQDDSGATPLYNISDDLPSDAGLGVAPLDAGPASSALPLLARPVSAAGDVALRDARPLP